MLVGLPAGDATADADVWTLVELLTGPDSLELLSAAARTTAELVVADEVAVFAGRTPPMLVAEHPSGGGPDRRVAGDPRLERAAATGRTVTLDARTGDGWRTGELIVRTGLWVPAPRDAPTPVVVRVLRNDASPFRPGTVRLVSIVARRLSVALRGIQGELLDRLGEAERTHLRDIAAAAVQHPTAAVVAERVVAALTDVTEFSSGTVELRHGATVRRRAAGGVRPAAIGVSSRLELWRDALTDDRRVGERTYRVALVEGLPAQGPQWPSAEPGLVSVLSEPDGRVAGFVTLTGPRVGAEPLRRTVETVELFSRLLQVGLTHARLADEAGQQRTMAATLLDVTTAVSRTMDPAATLATCVDTTDASSVAQRTTVWLLDGRTHARLAAASGTDADGLTTDGRQRLAIADCALLTDAVAADAPLVVEDVGASPRYAAAALTRVLQLRSVAAYPLRTDAGVAGVLVTDAHTRRVRFGEPETMLVHQIATQTAVALRQADLYAQVLEQAERTARLRELTTTMTTTLRFESVFAHIIAAVRQRMDAATVSVLRAGADVLEVLGTIADDRLHCPRRPLRLRADRGIVEALAALWRAGTVRLDDVRADPALSRLSSDATRGVLLAVPSEREDTDIVLAVGSRRTGAFTAGDEVFLADLAQVTKLAVRNARLYDEVAEAARRDPLTGLLNRRVFWEVLQAHLDDRRDGPVAVAVVDADHFKQVNDRHGHAVGDAALRHIAGRLTAGVRADDRVFRVGGEEFTVVLPGASERAAVTVLERVRRAIGEGGADLPSVSVSMGVAIAPDDATTPDALFSEADRALLHAKRAGRDRVVTRRALG